MYYRTLLAIGNTKASEIISCEQYIFFSLRNHTGRINTKMIIIFYQMIKSYSCMSLYMRWPLRNLITWLTLTGIQFPNRPCVLGMEILP